MERLVLLLQEPYAVGWENEMFPGDTNYSTLETALLSQGHREGEGFPRISINPLKTAQNNYNHAYQLWELDQSILECTRILAHVLTWD